MGRAGIPPRRIVGDHPVPDSFYLIQSNAAVRGLEIIRHKKVTETYLWVRRSFRRWCTRALISFWVREKVLLFTRFSPTAR